jgi:hypothetical protein
LTLLASRLTGRRPGEWRADDVHVRVLHDLHRARTHPRTARWSGGSPDEIASGTANAEPRHVAPTCHLQSAGPLAGAAFLVALAAFSDPDCGWRATSMVMHVPADLLAYPTGALRVPAGLSELAGLRSAEGQPRYVRFLMVLRVVQFGIGLTILVRDISCRQQCQVAAADILRAIALGNRCSKSRIPTHSGVTTMRIMRESSLRTCWTHAAPCSSPK